MGPTAGRGGDADGFTGRGGRRRPNTSMCGSSSAALLCRLALAMGRYKLGICVTVRNPRHSRRARIWLTSAGTGGRRAPRQPDYRCDGKRKAGKHRGSRTQVPLHFFPRMQDGARNSVTRPAGPTFGRSEGRSRLKRAGSGEEVKNLAGVLFPWPAFHPGGNIDAGSAGNAYGLGQGFGGQPTR